MATFCLFVCIPYLNKNVPSIEAHVQISPMDYLLDAVADFWRHDIPNSLFIYCQLLLLNGESLLKLEKVKEQKRRRNRNGDALCMYALKN